VYVVAAALAALVVSLVTIDLGPQLRVRAEAIGSDYLERPMHVGAVRAELWSGRVVLDDVRIEGRTPDAEPFLTADRLLVAIPWWSLFQRELIVEIEMDGWSMQIESWEGNIHSLPRIMPRTSSDAPGVVSTTVNFVFGRGGRFRYIDHYQPWDITCENLNINVVRARNLEAYVATIGFTGGVVNIMDYEPMTLGAMSTRLTIDGGLLRVHQMDVIADGSRSRMRGTVDVDQWPVQEFTIESDLEIARLKEIFFFGQEFTASGRGAFQGSYTKFRNGAYEVHGTFTSDLLRVSGLDFPKLSGRMLWVPNRLEVVGTESAFYGGTMRLAYALDSGAGRTSIADLSMTYRGVDLIEFGRVWGWDGIALASRANGWHAMQWPSGRFADMAGEGVLRATPMDDRVLAEAELPAVAVYAPQEVPFLKDRELDPQATGGVITYRMTPTLVTFGESWAATPETHLSFRGTTGWRDTAEIPFRVVSTDWLATDRLLAGVLTAFGSKTGAVDVGGRGVFDGVLTQWFATPHIEGHFTGDGIRAWDVVWGRARGDLVIENSYVTVSNSLVGERDADGVARMVVNGRYSLGYPRADGGEEFDARIRIDDWPLVDFRHAFLLDDWPVTGTAFADLRLYGDYEGPEGFGLMRVSPGTGWEETFDTFTARASFERVGMRLDGVEVTKSTGVVRGAAYVGWPSPQNNGFGTYSFTFDGERIPVESLVSFTVPDADLTGLLSFRMFGSGSNERPRYEWEGRIVDLFWGDEGIGQAIAHMVVTDEFMMIDRLEVASDRLAISGTGQVALNEAYDTEATLRFSETSVDPFLRFAAPGLSPYTRAVVSGAVRFSGELANLSRLGIDLTIDRADLNLLDFTLTNPIGADGIRTPLRLSFVDDVLSIRAFRLTGEATSLTLGGTVSRATEALNVSIEGTTNLAILQGVIQDVRASGNTTISARIGGTFTTPTYGGQATVTDGRLRHYSFPHSLDAISGRVVFDATGLRLDGLSARMGTGGRSGSGDIQFGGTIGLDGFLPGELNLTARGDGLDLRFPEGFRSIVDADLAVTGPVDDALLSGRVTVRQARYTRRLAGNVGLLGLAAAGGEGVTMAPAAPIDLPLTFAVDLVGQRLSVIDDADATIVVSPDLRFTGTVDQPQLAGRVDIDRGETEFLGNRYTIDGYVDFTNPNAIEPYFDIEARTRIRQPSQEYRIDLRFTGTLARFSYDLSSDPPLTQVDVLSLMLGQSPDLQRMELRTIESPQEIQNQLMSSVLAQLVASPITSPIGRVVERTLNVDTFTVTPLLSAEQTLQQLPNARITVGKKISNRVFLTYSRSLDNSTSLDYELLLLEYAQNERMSWVLSRNQDGTFALDFRVRYRF